MKVAIGSDHAGFEYKQLLVEMLSKEGYEVIDVGPTTGERTDYPDYAVAASTKVAQGEADAGVLVCGSGIGVAITANKIAGIRAATCVTTEMARLSRQHNNANVVCLGERLVTADEATKIVREFLLTSFEGGRHEQRVEKIHTLTGR